MTPRQLLNGIVYGSPRGPAIVIDWDNRKISYRRMPARRVIRLERWRRRGDAEAGRAAGFYEDDEDPREVFARFDAGPHVVTARPGYSAAEQVRRGLDYIRSTYGEAGDAL